MELAAEWHTRVKAHPLAPRPPPTALLDLMQGLHSIEGLGRSDVLLRQQLTERAARWGAADFFKFNPKQGEPPDGVREDCACGVRVGRDATECPVCRRPAVPMNIFDTWLEALVWSFHGCRMRIGLGACYFDVLRQVCSAFAERYPRRAELPVKERHYLCYCITHVIYTLNNFDERALSPALFPETVPAFLREQLSAAMDADDPDLAGELLDCLKCAHCNQPAAARQQPPDCSNQTAAPQATPPRLVRPVQHVPTACLRAHACNSSAPRSQVSRRARRWRCGRRALPGRFAKSHRRRLGEQGRGRFVLSLPRFPRRSGGTYGPFVCP